jgi:pyruvate/2-oxoglutarate/acetoin dehydrogenase E1 component
VDSVRRTNRCLIVEEGWSTYGVGAELAAGLQDRAFDDLDAPIRRLNGAFAPTPYSPPLERAVIPQVEDIVGAIRDLIEE